MQLCLKSHYRVFCIIRVIRWQNRVPTFIMYSCRALEPLFFPKTCKILTRNFTVELFTRNLRKEKKKINGKTIFRQGNLGFQRSQSIDLLRKGLKINKSFFFSFFSLRNKKKKIIVSFGEYVTRAVKLQNTCSYHDFRDPRINFIKGRKKESRLLLRPRRAQQKR